MPRQSSDLRLTRTATAFGLFALVEFISWVVVLLYAYSRGGAGLAGAVALLQQLPAILLAPPLVAVADRLPRGAALACTYLAEAALLAALAGLLRAEAPIAAVVVVSAGVLTLVSVARPMHYAALPQLAASARSLVRATSSSGAIEGASGFVGPILAGIGFATVGPGAVMVGCAAAMVIAGGLCVGLRLAAPPAPDAGAGTLRAVAEGLRVVAGDRAVLALVVLVGASFVVTGTLEILAVTFSDQVLGLGDGATGLVVGAKGIGAVLGAAAAAGLAFRARLAAPLVLSLVASGAALGAMAAAGSLAPALVLLALCGLGQSFAYVATRTLLQRSTDDRVLARVFAVQEAVSVAGLAMGAALAPLLIAAFGPNRAYLPLGLGIAMMALLAWRVLQRLDARVDVRPDVLAAMHPVPLLAAMAPPALARLSRAATWQDVPPGAVVIAQGDPGDAYYVVGTGRLSIEVDGVTRDRTLRAGDGFGEIALLQEVRRTATITALEPARLLRIERDDFLAAVTGSPDGSIVAMEVAAAHLARDAGPGRS